MMRRNICTLPFLVLLIVSLTVFSFAQQGRGKGRVRGNVVDVAGNPLEGVQITAEHLKFRTTFTSTSDKKGAWAVAGLGTGYFRITAQLEGYSPAYHEMRVSQFARNNPPVVFTLQRIQVRDMGVPAIEDDASVALFEEAIQLYDEENYAEAVVKFEEFIELNPTIYQININIGNCYREMGEYEKAIANYTAVLDKIKEEQESFEGSDAAARALASIGETHIKKGDLDKANEFLQQAIEIFPSDETLAFNIGEIFFKQGESAKGIEYFNRAIELKDDWPPPYRQRGYAFLNLADYKMALESFKKFVELAPDDPMTPTIKSLIPQLEQMIKR